MDANNALKFLVALSSLPKAKIILKWKGSLIGVFLSVIHFSFYFLHPGRYLHSI